MGKRYQDGQEIEMSAPQLAAFDAQRGDVRTKASLKGEVAAVRYVLETGGIVLGGETIRTDRESQAQLTAAFTTLEKGFVETVNWKAAGDVWVEVDLAAITPIARAVAQHVQACFTAEKAHHAAIDALGTQGAIDGYNVNAGWPQ